MKCIISGCWPSQPGSTPDDHVRILDTLIDYDPQLQFDMMKLKGKLTSPFVFSVRDSWSNDEIYGEPIWLPAYLLGWIDVAQMVPKFLKKRRLEKILDERQIINKL